MEVFLVDGTYELFRHFYALPSARDAHGREAAAVRGVLASIAGMLAEGTTHIGVATDHVIESFRNQLYPGYKTGDGVDPSLLSQFPMLEEALARLGVTVWPMVEQEADDALAAAAERASATADRILICTPDKDLAQCVRGDTVVQLDRRTGRVRNETGVRDRFGVDPGSIPDYLALVGDAADGFPGVRGWGARSAAAVLAHYRRLESIPRIAGDWEVRVRGRERLAATLAESWDDAILFRTLATLRTDYPVFDVVGELRWNGPREDFGDLCRSMRLESLAQRVRKGGNV